MYITAKAILIGRQVKLLKKIIYAKAMLDINFKIFMVLIRALKVLKTMKMMIYLSQATPKAAF